MSDLANLNICFLAGTLAQGGAERQLYYILQALRQAGATPRVLCLDQGGAWEEPIRGLGIPVRWIGGRPSRLWRLCRLVRELRREPPEVVQSQHFFANTYAAAAARLLGRTGIGAIRGNGSMDTQESGRAAGWLNLHAPRVLAANSRAALDYALRQGVPPYCLHFLPNAVDLSRFRPAGPRQRTRVQLLAVGRLVPVKRFDRFISALARLEQRFEGAVKGIIVGDGPLRPHLERQAAQLGLTPASLEFKGALTDLAPLYEQVDVCVLTSEREGTPNVVLEAMASGLPTVATRVGGVPEIIRHGQTGFLVEPTDIEGLCDRLLQLATDSELRHELGRRARAYVEARHSLAGLPACLSSLYQLALGNTGSGKFAALPEGSVG